MAGKKEKGVYEHVTGFMVDVFRLMDDGFSKVMAELFGLIGDILDIFSSDKPKKPAGAGAATEEVAKEETVERSKTVEKEKSKEPSPEVRSEAQKAAENVDATSVSDAELPGTGQALSTNHAERVQQESQQQQSVGGRE